MPIRLVCKDYYLLWTILLLTGLWCRPLWPVDETRAVSVAWEMWQAGDCLVPRLNGAPYSHKPPLLAWSIHALWWLLGVGEWQARLAGPLYGLGCLWLTETLGQHLWPDDRHTANAAPLMLLALPLWAVWTSLNLYDMPTCFFTLWGLLGIWKAAQQASWAAWAWVGIALGGGLLAKGPAVLVMLLPIGLFAPVWAEPKPAKSWRHWYLGLAAALALGVGLALLWAWPAGLAGGEAYQRMIFWGQTAGRVSQSFAHQRPVWWYLLALPLAGLPWMLWPPLWRAGKTLKRDGGTRFVLTQSLSALLLMSVVSGKQIHYLLPIFPGLALLCSRLVCQTGGVANLADRLPWALLPAALLVLPSFLRQGLSAKLAFPPALQLALLLLALVLLAWKPPSPSVAIRGYAYGIVALLAMLQMGGRGLAQSHFSMQAVAERLSVLQSQNAPIAYWQHYYGEFQFLGRLTQPLTEIADGPHLTEWFAAHPHGYVVLVRHHDPAVDETPAYYAQAYRLNRRLQIWSAEALATRPEIMQR